MTLINHILKQVSHKNRIRDLAEKYLNRTLTVEESDELFRWLDEVRDAEMTDDVFLEEWLHGDRNHRIEEVTWDQIRELSHEKRPSQSRILSVPGWKWAAAAVLIMALSSLWWWWGNTSEPEMVVYQTGYGETMPVDLEDGSRVMLNANSKMIWNRDWEKRGNGRWIELEGEAFFEVAHLETRNSSGVERIPFRVRTADLVVNVLGTSFNVSQRRGQTDVFLETGSIKLDLLELQTNHVQTDHNVGEQSRLEPIVMKPGERVRFSARSGELEKEEGDPSDWKEGTLTFTKRKFGEVLSSLEDIYGKQFEVTDENLLDRVVNLALPYENWETVRQLIGMPLNIEFIEQENTNEIRIEKRSGK